LFAATGISFTCNATTISDNVIIYNVTATEDVYFTVWNAAATDNCRFHNVRTISDDITVYNVGKTDSIIVRNVPATGNVTMCDAKSSGNDVTIWNATATSTVTVYDATRTGNVTVYDTGANYERLQFTKRTRITHHGRVPPASKHIARCR
jgi:hypothetical protein